MLFKSAIAAAAIAVTAVLGTATAAHADPQIGVSIGFGFGDFSPEPRRHFGGPDPFWEGRFRHERRDFGGADSFEGDQFEGDRFHHEHPHIGWGYGEPRRYASYGLSCSSAGNVVRGAGFRGVQATDCSRPVYSFEAWKRGEIFRVNVSVAGRIVAVEPIY